MLNESLLTQTLLQRSKMMPRKKSSVCQAPSQPEGALKACVSISKVAAPGSSYIYINNAYSSPMNQAQVIKATWKGIKPRLDPWALAPLSWGWKMFLPWSAMITKDRGHKMHALPRLPSPDIRCPYILAFKIDLLFPAKFYPVLFCLYFGTCDK